MPEPDWWAEEHAGETDPQTCAEFRVRWWLERYPQLATALYYDCSIDASEQQCGASLHSARTPPDARWVSLVCIKADLDRCIDKLPKRLAVIIALHYAYEYPDAEIAAMIKVSRPRVTVLRRRWVTEIARRLVIPIENAQ